jgi:hypothetical protein
MSDAVDGLVSDFCGQVVQQKHGCAITGEKMFEGENLAAIAQ